MTYQSRKRGHQWYVSQYLRFLHQHVAELLADDVDASSDLHAALTCASPVVLGAGADWQAWLLAAGDAFTTETVHRLRALAPVLHRGASYVAGYAGTGPTSLLWHLYEILVGGMGKERKARGVYYTPQAVARFVVAQADRELRDHFALPCGLADDLPFRILEPACGSGAFVAAVLEQVCCSPTFDQATAERSIASLIAIDISPVAVFLTRLRIAFALCGAGIKLSATFPQPVCVCGNALAGPEAIHALREPIGIVLGNPPFSYLSQNEQPWIQSLIRGDEKNAGYFAIDGEALGEKKTWLHDDYVKFMRLAQWCIEQNGTGVVSLVTNHGWLDNATFRIARQHLLRTFTQIDVVDLHGNAKRHEVNPSGDRDENVFGIGQGIALVTLTKAAANSSKKVSHVDLWGSRQDKLKALEQAANGERLPAQSIIPAAPWHTFAVQNAAIPAEYQAAPLLTELMPVNSTVPVTARDHFVIARTPTELLERLHRFCDLTISDETIRAEYFSRTRSNRYAAGDTRSWKLGEARRIVREAGELQPFIRRCLYRPFVWRYVFWHPAMIDWPRNEFTRHLLSGNLALLARRQSIAGREANFFWITDCLPLDGVIRSDNRGSESFFPLLLSSTGNEQKRPLNMSTAICGDFEPSKMLAYFYGLVHSPTYRTRYSAALGMEFPRVLMPRTNSLFEGIAEFGGRLIKIHLTNPLQTKITINRDLRLAAAIENFHVGTYNVCRKWLQMEQQNRESPAFAGLQQLICYTLQVQEQMEEVIAKAGGFPAAFR